MDSMDSLNRLNPVDDNDKLKQVKLTSSLFGFPSSCWLNQEAEG